MLFDCPWRGLTMPRFAVWWIYFMRRYITKVNNRHVVNLIALTLICYLNLSFYIIICLHTSLWFLLPRDALYCKARYCRRMLSVRLSVTFRFQWSHRLEFFENNFTAEQLRACVRADPSMSHLVQWEHPQNWGGINVGLKWEFSIAYLFS